MKAKAAKKKAAEAGGEEKKLSPIGTDESQGRLKEKSR